MLRILRYLPVHCAKGAEFAAFAYVSWSSLDGLLVCLLWCGFSEFRVIRGSCGRIARNLVDSLHFPGFSVGGQRSESELDMD